MIKTIKNTYEKVENLNKEIEQVLKRTIEKIMPIFWFWSLMALMLFAGSLCFYPHYI